MAISHDAVRDLSQVYPSCTSFTADARHPACRHHVCGLGSGVVAYEPYLRGRLMPGIHGRIGTGPMFLKDGILPLQLLPSSSILLINH